MKVINKYIEFLEGAREGRIQQPRFPVRIAEEAGLSNGNETIDQCLLISSLLRDSGIGLSIAGSGSIKIQTRMPISPHDIDFVVRQSDIQAVGTALQAAGYDFWSEDYVHRDIRPMTGGFGRHHNYGLSTPGFLQPIGLPTWMGVFTYEEVPNGVAFYENFAISAFKVDWLFSKLCAKRPGTMAKLPPDFKITQETLMEFVGFLSKNGINFWGAINRPDFNDLDIERRNTLMGLELGPGPNGSTDRHKEVFFEFRMTTTYGITPEEYLFSSKNSVLGTELFTVPLEVSYLRYSDPRYSPHFLGRRPKYEHSAALIEGSGALDSDLLKRFAEVYRGQERTHELLSSFTLEHDATIDPDMLKRQLQNGMRAEKGEVNYLPFLLEGTHYELVH